MPDDVPPGGGLDGLCVQSGRDRQLFDHCNQAIRIDWFDEVGDESRLA